MNEVLSAKWEELRGLKVVSVALGSVTLPDEDAEMIKQAQRTAMMRDPAMAAATLTGAQADAMKAAASNSAGAMTGFMGMGMAANTGGLNAQQLFEMGQKQQAQQQSVQQQAAGTGFCRQGTEQGLRLVPGPAAVVRFLRGNSVRSVVHRVRWRTAGPVPAVR